MSHLEFSDWKGTSQEGFRLDVRFEGVTVEIEPPQAGISPALCDILLISTSVRSGIPFR